MGMLCITTPSNLLEIALPEKFCFSERIKMRWVKKDTRILPLDRTFFFLATLIQLLTDLGERLESSVCLY